MQYDTFITHSIDLYMGKPKSGKTLIAGSYPKPLLYVSVGDDGGGREDCEVYRSAAAARFRTRFKAHEPHRRP